jgi:spermidine synthase
VAGRRRGPASLVAPVDHGVAELVPDPDRPGGWTLLLDGYPQSYVDIADPAHLDFEYVRRLASIVDAAAPLREPLNVLHLGGGALTVPRYVALTRPRSSQRVIERDAALIAFVRRELPLPRDADIRVRAEDARAAVEGYRDGRFDLVIADVYGGARVPARLASIEFVTRAARLLTPTGMYAVNLADGAPLAFTRTQVATLHAAFGDVCLLAEPSVLRGRRFGNVVLVAAAVAGRLPIAELAAAAARDPFPARLVHGADLVRFAAGARPATDATAVDSPLPPDNLFDP